MLEFLTEGLNYFINSILVDYMGISNNSEKNWTNVFKNGQVIHFLFGQPIFEKLDILFKPL